MKLYVVLAIVIGAMVGTCIGYVTMQPFMKFALDRNSIARVDTASIVTLRGTIESIDRSSRTLTIRVHYPGYLYATAPIRIPFNAVQNFLNLDNQWSTAQEYVRAERSDILTTHKGQRAMIRLLRTPGTFTVLALIVSSPITYES